MVGAAGPEIKDGELTSESGQRYRIRHGIPVFVPSAMLTDMEQETQTDYDAQADQKYDAAVDWQFRSFLENEDDVRERMVDLLALKPDARVLEIGCGTGRDSFRIARRLDRRGEFFMQDLSENMVLKTQHRMDD
jgi:ubiquinone/menaquinone biosynthesis C-methylase UbiE